jgi:hypothetical protein
MKPFIIAVCTVLLCCCHKSQTEKQQQQKIDCGCTTDSIINVCVDSVGWLNFDSASNVYLIHDTVQYNFLNIYWICNPEIKDISSIKLVNDSAIEIFYSGKVKLRCPDSLFTLPEVFPYNITIDSLRKK